VGDPDAGDEQPRRRPKASQVVSALVGGFLFGFVLAPLWWGFVFTSLGWLMSFGRLTTLIGSSIPLVVGLVWIAGRGRKRELGLETKTFVVAMYVGWLVFVFGVPMILLA
jgi:hypothetical protein